MQNNRGDMSYLAYGTVLGIFKGVKQRFKPGQILQLTREDNAVEQLLVRYAGAVLEISNSWVLHSVPGT